jgi:2-haloalkanoic acid dehalogenase type II
MARLTDFRILCFDVYGTLIDWETGVVNALQPWLQANHRTDVSRKQLLDVFHELESKQQEKTPDMAYADLLGAVHPQVAAALQMEPPSTEGSRAFGRSVGKWPAFPDTVDALHKLKKQYKLVVLSNVDRESFAASNAGPLQGFPFDLIITAQDVGSYKPNLENFRTMLNKVKDLFGIEQAQVLQTAQSQFHDHQPAREIGIKSCWIVRPGAVMGNRSGEVFNWKFDSLGEMADAVDAEVGSQ